MSNDLNRCEFIGRLGKDVDLRSMPSGGQVANFSLAVGEKYKNKQGEQVENTEWVSVSAFGKLAEIMGQYLSKGSQVFISGRMKTDKYQAKDGTDRYSTKIIADKLQMLGGKPDTQQNTSQKPANTPADTTDYFNDDIGF